MNKDKLPFTKETIEKAISIAGKTPFYIYDKNAIIENLKNFQKAFSWVDNFKEYYAVKACPNPYILEILKENGAGADCSSL
jgi:diaminopimelate decarboxylase